MNSHKNLQKVYNIGREWEKNNVKVFGQAFFKRLAVSKGGALVALRRVRNFLFRRALRKGLNLQNDPVDRFAKRGNPAREGSPLPADFADYPFTKQVKTAYLDLVSSRLSASQSLLCDLVCTPIRRRLPFARAKGSKTRSGKPRDPTHRNARSERLRRPEAWAKRCL